MADRTKFVVPEKPKHPLGWACEKCLYVVKDTNPNSKQMKCCFKPPIATFAMVGPGQQAVIALSPPVQEGEWCGEFKPDPREPGYGGTY